LKASMETLLVVTAYPHMRWIPACAGMIRLRRTGSPRASLGFPSSFPQEWGTKGVDEPHANPGKPTDRSGDAWHWVRFTIEF
jgi:hypothetical protein